MKEDRTSTGSTRCAAERNALVCVIYALSQARDLEEYLNEVYEQVAVVVRVEGFAIALTDQDGEVVLPFVIEQGEHRPQESVGANRGFIERVVAECEPLLLVERLSERAAEMGIEVVDPKPLSWMGVPMLVRERSVGALCVSSWVDENAYTEADLELLSVISCLVAVAVENARLYAEAYA